ncbi:MAG: nitroreductase family protein [Myxococcota bacterium]
MSELSLHDAIYSLRAMRRLKSDPVPEADLRRLIDAATQAASGENRQRWAFVVVTDPDKRRRLGEIYRALGHRYLRDAGLERDAESEDLRRVYRGALALVERLGEAPALILVCVRGRAPSNSLESTTYYGSIFPAIQNLMLTARSLGLGTTLTTLHKARDAEVKEVLGIPDEVETVALIPVGYPEGRFGKPRRRPGTEVTHWNRWEPNKSD